MTIILYPTLLKLANLVELNTSTKLNHKSTKSAKLINLDKSIKSVKSNSWFDITIRKNNNIKDEFIPVHYDYTYTNTKKIVLTLDNKQESIIKLWLDDAIDVYNLTNKYIKDNLETKEVEYIKKNNDTVIYINYTNFYKLVNFRRLRATLKVELKEICKKNNLPKHQADYQVKHCVEMYKSAYSNLINKHIKQFNIFDLCKDRRRKNMVIEPGNVSKTANTIFASIFKKIKSNLRLSIIKKNSILQLDTLTNKFIIITPYDEEYEVELEQNKKCGIDPGCRTFLTVYSPEETYEICTNTYELIDKYHKKLDSLKSNREKLSISKYNFTREKYQSKLNNHINDLHAKSSRFILERFKTIKLGKISISSIVSNKKGNICAITKRRILALSHYKFRMKLQQMSVKWNNKIILIDESYTSKTCCSCHNIKNDLGLNKIYKCSKCNLIIDRDINASINIYNSENICK